MGSPHFLYRPDAPHCIGRYEQVDSHSEGLLVSHLVYALPHDCSTRQVLFTDGNVMLERDIYTGMQRPVRRQGPPLSRHPSERNVLFGILLPPCNVFNLPKDRYCGLCHSTNRPLMQMECCGGYVCDTEDQYEMMSNEREGQCARNHRYGSICFFHYQEKHTGDDWKTSEQCQNSFSPYDYAVKALSMANSGTSRRYNFDDNVRSDLDLTKIPFPACYQCHQPVNTTEETTRTLSMRKHMSAGRVSCVVHGGGFGRVVMASFWMI